MSSPIDSSQWMYASGGFYGHEISNSLRFEDGDSPVLTRTPGSASNQRVWTWSGWVKRGNIGINSLIFGCGSDANNFAFIGFSSDNTIDVRNYQGGSYTYSFKTTQLFRDVSAWYHLVLAADMANSTATDRIKLYVNGVRVTNFSSAPEPSTSDLLTNSDIQHVIGCGYYNDGSGLNAFLDGYLAEVNLIDGTALTPASFGETKSGVWIPKDTSGLTFGTNGFRLEFKQTGTGTASTSTIGADTSGETNHFTSANLAATDQMPDSPTNNWCTLNRNLPDSHFNTDRLSEGNLFYNEGQGNNGDGHPTATMGVTSGKWYWEVQVPSAQNNRAIGFTRTDNIGKGNVELHGAGLSATNSVVGIDLTDDTIDQVDKAGTHTQEASGLTGMSNNDIFGISVDLDGGTFQMYRNGSTYGSSYNLDDLADWQTHGMTPTASGDAYQAYRFNFGQDSSFAGNKTSGSASAADGNGVGDFYYSPPSGYLSLCSANLPDPAIDPAKDETPADYFNTVLYTGDGSESDNDISGVGFSPDFIWIKSRSNTYNHQLVNTVAGIQKTLLSDNTDVEYTDAPRVNSVSSDGFNVFSSAQTNVNNGTFVAWNWLAGTAASGSESGNNPAFSSSSSSKAGFSIVSYTGTGSAGTVGHGCGAVPSFIFIKNRDATDNWAVYYGDNTDYLILNTVAATADAAAWWNDTTPTDSVFTVGTDHAVNADGEKYIAYCFASIEGYSKVGSYTGNGSADGAFVFTGFRPAWILVKRTNSSTGSYWDILDNKRNATSGNPVDEVLMAHTNTNEAGLGNVPFDFLSNGFKTRDTTVTVNGSGSPYIYLAFAEQPFKYANAR